MIAAAYFIFLLIFCVNAYGGELKESDIYAKGAVLIDRKTGVILWGKNERAPLAMASTTKIMTAIVA
ncbi:MAG: D-alanyl-D-alanine carboxypeptidase, partial [Firmicutes bacterium]|nr:D-alanyl-D-alanine carboxypeptidase [Bacillota bacterium]